MLGGLGKSAIGAAAIAMMLGAHASPAIQPEPEHKRVLYKVPSRGEKKKAKRRAEHAQKIASKWGRRGNKLGRRIRRKFELGRSGSF